MPDKLYIVRKYVMAPSASAIRREKDVPVSDVWLDEDWAKALKENPEPRRPEIGF